MPDKSSILDLLAQSLLSIFCSSVSILCINKDLFNITVFCYAFIAMSNKFENTF